jgi:hypothetical protein
MNKLLSLLLIATITIAAIPYARGLGLFFVSRAVRPLRSAILLR